MAACLLQKIHHSRKWLRPLKSHTCDGHVHLRERKSKLLRHSKVGLLYYNARFVQNVMQRDICLLLYAERHLHHEHGRVLFKSKDKEKMICVGAMDTSITLAQYTLISQSCVQSAQNRIKRPHGLGGSPNNSQIPGWLCSRNQTRTQRWSASVPRVCRTPSTLLPRKLSPLLCGHSKRLFDQLDGRFSSQTKRRSRNGCFLQKEKKTLHFKRPHDLLHTPSKSKSKKMYDLFWSINTSLLRSSSTNLLSWSYLWSFQKLKGWVGWSVLFCQKNIWVRSMAVLSKSFDSEYEMTCFDITTISHTSRSSPH